MVAWYKHDIPAWMDGTEALEDGPYRAYHVICQLIYLNEGPIALNEHGIAGRSKMHILKFRKCLDHLLTIGKLTLNPNQTLDQPRANLELRKIGTNRVNAGLGGSAPRKPLKNNGADEATLENNASLKTREEETRLELYPDAKASRTKAAYSDDFETNFWKAYPRSATMSKKEAWREWMKLTPDKRQLACKAIEPYRKYLRSNPNISTVHACRFLSQERFDGLLESAAAPTFDIRSSLV